MDPKGDREMDFCSQIDDLENSEMTSGFLSPDQYVELFCLYLHSDRLMDARFLWKRIPSSAKTEGTLLKSIWDLTVLLLQRRNSEFLSSCREFLSANDTSPYIQSHLEAVYHRVQRSTVDAIKSSFSCVPLEKVCAMLCLPHDEALSLMENWALSSDGFITAPSESRSTVNCTDQDKVMSDFMQTLTEFSSFMENM